MTSMMGYTKRAWNDGLMKEIPIACQGNVMRSKLFGGIVRTVSSGLLFDVGIFLILYRFVRTLLKPLHMPFVSQLLAGFIVGPFFGKYVEEYAINKPSLILIASVLANIGFYLQLFALGVEVNLGKLRKTGKKAFIISYLSLFTSIAFSSATYFTMRGSLVKGAIETKALAPILIANATNYLLNTSSHLNDLGISNSKLGQLASSIAMITDISVMLISITILNLVIPFVVNTESPLQSLVLFYYALLFCVIRPLILYLVSFKKEGRPLKRKHFVSIIILILIMGLMGEGLKQKYSAFLLALTLPEEPLATIFVERLNPITSNILFPFFVFSCVIQMKIPPKFDTALYALVTILIMGYIGKFLGIIFSAWFLHVPFSQAGALALIMSTRGVLDISSLEGLVQNEVIKQKQYTILIFHASITMGVFLPFVKLLYEPSRQYSTIMRHSVFDFQENNKTLQILVCIHKERSLPGLMHFLKVCHSTQQNSIAIIALQLLQLAGRCAMPIMAPLHEVSSISSLSSNMDRCNRIVKSFLSLERKTKGRTRAQHFVAMSPYGTMHNDICNLAYEKAVGLVILPFHITWAPDGTISDSSLAIREVNNMVLKKAPCSVGLLVDRSNSKKRVIDEDKYMISIVFVGGGDDYEALAYGRVFAEHPYVRLNVIWLKPPLSNKDDEVDYKIVEQFRRSCKNNERVNFQEVIVNNGAESIQALVSMKEDVDLIVTGKFHDPQSIPFFGLSDGWTEYPELGILGDIFASDFEFSLLVVQQEPPNELAFDFEDE